VDVVKVCGIIGSVQHQNSSHSLLMPGVNSATSEK